MLQMLTICPTPKSEQGGKDAQRTASHHHPLRGHRWAIALFYGELELLQPIVS